MEGREGRGRRRGGEWEGVGKGRKGKGREERNVEVEGGEGREGRDGKQEDHTPSISKPL